MIEKFQSITTLDLVVIGVYLVFMLLVGVFFIKRIKGEADYYVAGRSLGTVVMMATVCATIIGGSAMMGRAAKAFNEGFPGLITAVPYMIGMFVFSGLSGRINLVGTQHNITSIPELMDRRFGRAAKLITSALVAFAMTGTVAAQVSATATIIKMVGGGIGISFEMGAFIATTIFFIYTAASGLFGVVYTDVVQFFMLLIFVYILIPIRSTSVLGGFDVFLERIDPNLLKPYINGAIVSDIIAYLVFTIAGAEMWQRAFAAKSKKVAKKGMFLGTAVYACTIALVVYMGLIGTLLIPNVAEVYGTTDAIVPALAINIFPSGVTGLAIAGILSVMMSTADSYLLVATQTCIHDIGKTFRPEMSDKREILYSRIMSAILAFGALFIALRVKSVYAILTSTFAYYAASAGLPAFAALYWKKATAPGVISGMVGGLAVSLVWEFLGQPLGLGPAIPGTAVCAILLIGVSLATCKKKPSVYLGVTKA